MIGEINCFNIISIAFSIFILYILDTKLIFVAYIQLFGITFTIIYIQLSGIKYILALYITSTINATFANYIQLLIELTHLMVYYLSFIIKLLVITIFKIGHIPIFALKPLAIVILSASVLFILFIIFFNLLILALINSFLIYPLQSSSTKAKLIVYI